MSRRMFMTGASAGLLGAGGLVGCAQPGTGGRGNPISKSKQQATVTFTPTGGATVAEKYTATIEVASTLDFTFHYLKTMPVPAGFGNPKPGTLTMRFGSVTGSRNGVEETPEVTESATDRTVTLTRKLFERGPYEAILSSTSDRASREAGGSLETFVQVGTLGDVTFSSADIQLVEIYSEGRYTQTGEATDGGWFAQDVGPDWRKLRGITSPMLFRVTRNLSAIEPAEIVYS